MRFNNYERQLLDYIQLPDSAYTEAMDRYNSVGKYLQSDSSILKKTAPEIRAQGSFRLGTAIYPQSREKEFDLDITMICIGLTPDNCTQSDFKEVAKTAIQTYADLHGMERIEEKSRCVRLNYKSSKAGNSSFHIDIVPAIHSAEAEKEAIRQSKGLYDDLSIYITDIHNPNFKQLHSRWPTSNPEGFALWFESRMRPELDTEKRNLMLSDGVTDIPTWKVRTGLQSSVQLLKWHRDCMFIGDDKCKPASIIITTLAAMAYDDSISDVSTLVQRMVYEFDRNGGIIRNPVDPREVFTDKWDDPEHADDHLRVKFIEWIRKAYTDFSILEKNNMQMSAASMLLSKAFNFRSIQNVGYHKPEVIIRKPVNKPYGY